MHELPWEKLKENSNRNAVAAILVRSSRYVRHNRFAVDDLFHDDPR